MVLYNNQLDSVIINLLIPDSTSEMPIYDYRCDENQQVVEVSHRMNEKMTTWGELCANAGIEAGSTPLDAAVTRLITGGKVNKIVELPRFDPSILPK